VYYLQQEALVALYYLVAYYCSLFSWQNLSQIIGEIYVVASEVNRLDLLAPGGA